MAAAALIFDVDGTLWRSLPYYASILADITDCDEEAILERLIAGESIFRILNEQRVGRPTFTRACQDRIGEILFPRVAESLSVLSEKEIPLAIVTSLPGDSFLIPLLAAANLLDHFGAVIHAGNCAARKPSPIGISRAIASLGLEPSSNIFYIGDREIDARAAKNAGISSAWASWGSYEEQPECTVVLRSFDEILTL